MDQLFAPWRIEWVKRDSGDVEGCPFCVLPTREDAVEARVVAESTDAFVLLNTHPYNPGHVMVIPREHTGEYTALEADALLDHSRLCQRTIEALESAFDPGGINVGLNLGNDAGGSIDDHLHTHVVPRWRGDTNFMPITADTKVIVQAVDDTYEALREAFATQPDAAVGERGSVELSL